MLEPGLRKRERDAAYLTIRAALFFVLYLSISSIARRLYQLGKYGAKTLSTIHLAFTETGYGFAKLSQP